MSPVMERLHTLLGALGLSEIDALLEAHLEQAVAKEATYADLLLSLLELETQARGARALQTRMRLAGLPYCKTLAQFDYSFQPTLDEKQVRELSALRFAQEAHNVILLGPPGVGKTHLAVGLSIEAMKGGFSTYFVTAHDLVADLGRAAREGKLERRLRVYLHPKVLVIDEVGYLPLDDVGATIFFQVVSARYERGSILLTSNKSYGEWGTIFGEHTLASAILDRLLHHATTLNIRGESYRLRERRKAGLIEAVTKGEKRAG